MRGCKKGVPHDTYGKRFSGDWSEVINDIQYKMNLTDLGLAFLLDCHKTSISKWRLKKWCPSEYFGEKLLLLWTCC